MSIGQHARLDKHKMTSLADHRPRRGLRRPRIVENGDTSHFILQKETHIGKENNKYLFTSMF
jgi:hypothetical protein